MTTKQIDTTAEKLREMLQENTGCHFLDSGGAYGRNWQRNRGADFEAQPEGHLEFYYRDGVADMLVTINIYHFLKDRLEYNPELDKHYRQWCIDNERGYWLPSAEDFVKSLDGAAGIYREGEPFAENTYNGQDLLSQVIQYVYWTDDDGAHVMLQIHGGCDVRGGYTDPVAFDVADYDGTSIFDNARASIYCNDCGAVWDTDDGYHWAPEGFWGKDYKQLQEYPVTDERPEYPEKPDPAQQLLPIDLPKRPEPCAGVVWVDDERNGHCPYCGGLLHIAPWPAGLVS